MAFQHKPGSFTLFKNDKGDNDKRPDYRGEGLDLNGKPIEVAAWIKEGNKGKYMSCTFKPHGDAQPQRGTKPALDDDIPFSPLRKVESSLL
jgi:hypothetical protein